MTSFRQAVEGLYAAFATYPLRDVVEGCSCCTSAADNRDLHAAPLHELTTDHLRHYGFSALFTWGDLTDFKHFLPRLLELAATEGFEGPDTESLYGRLAHGGFSTWSAAEQKAVRVFARAHWRLTLADESADDSDAVLTGLALLGVDLGPYLADWEEYPEDIASFAASNVAAMAQGQLRNAYHDGTTAAAQRGIIAWIRARM